MDSSRWKSWLSAQKKTERKRPGPLGCVWSVIKTLLLAVPVMVVVWLLERQKGEQAGDGRWAAESLPPERESYLPAVEPVAVERRAGERSGAASGTEQAAPVEAPPPTQTSAPVAPEGRAKPPKPDDLARIEGIGPKVKALLKELGYTTFDGLAGADPEELRSMLQEKGLYMMDPATWPEQARLLAEGREAEFQELKERLRGGRRRG